MKSFKDDYNLTKKAEQILLAAGIEAMKLGALYIGTEHILLALLSVACMPREIFATYGVTYEHILNVTKKFIAKEDGKKSRRKKSPELSPRALDVLSIAREEAERGHMELIGSEHLAIALMCQEDSVAKRLLHTANFIDEKFAIDLYRAMGEDGIPYLEAMQDGFDGPEGTPTIERFSRDLTYLAKEGRLDPVIGREAELDRLIRTLSRRTKNNPCLIGEPGVGKTAIVERLALDIAAGKVPESIAGKRLLSLDLGSMVAGTKYRGEFEERIEAVIKEAASDGNILLFLDELHTIIGAGGAEGSLDAANILKPALSRGEIQIIGATTVDEYRKHIEKDAALERRFQSILIEEPTQQETIKILEGLRESYEKHHNLQINDAAIEAAAYLSSRYITDRCLPDKAIDLLDEACAKARIRAKKKDEDIVISDNEIASVVSDLTRIPVSKLTETESSRLKKLEDVLHKRVISQDEAVSAVASAVRRGRVGLKDPKRPIGSFLFLGPTGVGKTELAKTLASALFGRDDAMIRVDMSEYMEQHSVSKIIGSPPGYVGYDEGGQLSEKIRKNPYCVLLFDEIEKAHPDIFHVLLQILDDGHITDAQGRKVDFKNTIIIMTSNAGAERIVAPKKLGFSADDSEEADYRKMKEGVMDEIKKLFKPELLNRIDEIIVFHALGRADIKRILGMQLRELSARTKESLGITLKVKQSAKDFLMEKGYDPKYGARPLRRAIQTELEDALALEVLGGEIKSGDKVEIAYDKKIGKMTFNA